MARFRSFQEISALAPAALARIVERSGDPPERVWAAWALGMRHVDGTASLLLRAAAKEPAPGVRAHFALLLVAHGETDAVGALARFDPDTGVRVAACRALARAAKPTDTATNALLVERLADPEWEVRLAVCDGLRDDAPEDLRARCAEILREKDALDEELARAAEEKRKREEPPPSSGPVPALVKIRGCSRWSS